MAIVSKGNKTKPREVGSGSGPGALTHNPFARLTGLGLPPGPAAAPAAPPPEDERPRPARRLIVRRTRKGRAGHTVTQVEGLDAGRLEDTARRLKKALGCGARVEGEHVVVLGDLEDRVAQWLRDDGATEVVFGSR